MTYSKEEFIELLKGAREQLGDPKDVEHLDQLIAGYAFLAVPNEVKEELAQLREHSVVTTFPPTPGRFVEDL